MGRPERPVDPDDGPVHQLAAALRELRREAGNPTYRELSERSHFSSSALSRAASGHSLPTLSVTLGFVAACGADSQMWRQRWQEAAIASGQILAEPSQVPASGASVVAGDRPETDANHTTASLRPRWLDRFRMSPRPLVLWAAAAAVLMAATMFALSSDPDAHRNSTATVPMAMASTAVPYTGGLPSQPVADGVDPKRSGCAEDGVTLASTPLTFPANRLAGTVELRYSPHCSVAWARFVPAPTGRGPNDTVTVDVDRPSDGVEIPFTITYGDEAVYSDVLRTSIGCVVAKAWIVTSGQRSPAVSTACRTGA